MKVSAKFYFVSIFSVLIAGGQTLAREVSISMASGQSSLILTNPSTMSVSYDVRCYRADGSTTLLNLTGQTLLPNARVTHTAELADSGKCLGGTNPEYTGTDTSSKPYYMCSGSNSYASAGSACGTGNAFCFPDVSYGIYTCACGTFWIKNEGSAEIATGCGGFAAITGGNQVAIGNYMGGNVRKSPSVGCGSFYYAAEYADNTTRGAICCSSPVPASLCKVTITTTSTNAYLASPSFQGGAAF